VVEVENAERTRPDKKWLNLRIIHTPVKKSSLGALTLPYAVGSEVQVQRLDKVKGWAPLAARYNEAEQTSAGRARGKFPTSSRPEAAQRFWRAKVALSDGQGNIVEQMFMLQAAAVREARSMQTIGEYMDHLLVAIHHAERYNHHLIRTGGGGQGFDAVSIPGIKIAAPVVCEVFSSSVPDLVGDGEAVLLVPYNSPDVHKFVFDGSEEFMEIPQGFFHHAAVASDGRTFVTDIQGTDLEDGEFVIVDPCVMQLPKPTPQNLFGSLFSFGQKSKPAEGEASALLSQGHFEALHPRCGPLCKAFDPQRKAGQPKRQCGVALPSCGIGGA